MRLTLVQRFNDPEGAIFFQRGDFRARPLNEQNIANAQGQLTDLTVQNFSVPADPEHLQAVTLAKANAFKRSFQQRRTAEQNDFDNAKILGWDRRIPVFEVGFNFNSCDVFHLQ